jgi:HAMP domain-containing protein
MFDFIKTRLGIQITLFISIFLFFMVIVGSSVIYITQTKDINEQFISKGKNLSRIGAKSIGRFLENAIEDGIFTEKDAFDKQYEQIPGFVPPKYRTRYDSYLDKAILGIQDEFLKDPNILYAIAMDSNGYVPTHNSRFQKQFTGDKQKDYYGNRTKRIFNDPITIKATQNIQEAIVQKYEFDAQEDIWDISSPIFVTGKHWGCFKIGYKTEASENAKLGLLRLLFVVSFLFLGISISAIHFIVNRSLQPLVEFTQTTVNLADGDVERPIRSKRKDEIGQIAEALERLRVSLKAAMDRLMR